MGKNRRRQEELAAAPTPFWRSPPLWLFAGALALRLAHLLLYKGDFWLMTPLLDDNIFVSWADVIRREGWLARSLGVFDLNPGYPYFLALMGRTVGAGYAAVFAVQHLAGALAPVLLYALCVRAFDRRTALCAGILGALYGPAVFYESRFLGESWIYLLNLSALACLVGAEGPALYGLAGLCLGLSAVFRPTVLAFFPVAAAWAAWSLRARPKALAAAQGLPSSEGGRSPLPKRAAALLCLAAGLWLPMLPFQLRNRAVDPSRGWGLTTSSGGVNFYLGNNPEADGLNKAPAFIRYGPGHEYKDFREEAERRTGRQLGPAEVSRYWAGQAVRWMLGRPSAAAGLLARKTGFFWNHREPPDNFFMDIFDRFTRLGGVPLAAWGLVAPLGLAGLLLSLGQPGARGFWVLHGYVLAYFGVNVLFYILSRYRFPTAAGLIPFAAFALVRLADLARERRASAAVAPATVLALCCLGLSRLPLIGEEDQASSHYSKAVIYANQGWRDRAVEEYRASIQADPAFQASYLNLGILQAGRGELREAAWALEGALRLEADPAKAANLRRNIDALKSAGAGPSSSGPPRPSRAAGPAGGASRRTR